jgi:hypothetical protein
MRVTVNRVFDVGPTESDTPSSGKRYVGVSVSMTNVGSANYDDSPSNGMKLIMHNDTQADSTILTDQSACSAPGSVTLAPNETRRFCVPFEIPDATRTKQVQIGLDSGFADEKAAWLTH